MTWTTVLNTLVSMILVGITEEGAFRYVIQDMFLQQIFRLKRSWAIGIASVLFGCAHFINPGNWVFNLPQVIGATFGGVYLGVKYHQKNLLWVIVVHGLYNFCLMMIY